MITPNNSDSSLRKSGNAVTFRKSLQNQDNQIAIGQDQSKQKDLVRLNQNEEIAHLQNNKLNPLKYHSVKEDTLKKIYGKENIAHRVSKLKNILKLSFFSNFSSNLNYCII